MTVRKRRAPALRRIRVEGVKLYNDGGVLEVELTKPISAFVGANGIGKSTLLALANFGLTGLVPNGDSAFPSVEEFAERTSSFAAAYFSGRVDESDRQAASVTVEFRLGDAIFLVERGLFEGRLLRSFSVDDPETGERSHEADDTTSPSDLALSFQNAVVEASGLATFDQFCFWQLFMMTFDERRHLLFWDDKTLQSTLMISLGRSPQDAVEAEALNRNIERQDSLARNARWRATQATNKRSRLTRDVASASTLTDEEFLALTQTHDALVNAEMESKKLLDAKEVELRDISRSVAELAITESELEQTYLALFAQSDVHRDPTDHPIIKSILISHSCELCGSKVQELGSRSRDAIARSICPLCDSNFTDVPGVESTLSDLVELDNQLASAKKSVGEARTRYHRLRDESAQHASSWRENLRSLEEFLSLNERQIDLGQATNYSNDLLQYDREISAAMKDAEEHRNLRDTYRQKLEPIILGLVDAYAQIETVFVPNFRRLAEQFIGRSVDLEFERRGVSIGLRFALDGQSRRSASELSESQQYFLDIALRMSLVQTFMSDSCTLLVDTPEGSLDIAYETRAGLLFDRFAKSGHSMMIMSNLNSSNLLGQLTRLASHEEMEIVKMIGWARLSEVQIENASLFDDVYDRLESALGATEERDG